MNFKDIIPENITELPGRTSGVMEKLKQFYADQLPQPYWDEYTQSEMKDSPEPGSVHKVTDGNISAGEKNAVSFDVDISFSKVPHDVIVGEVAEKIREFGGMAIDMKATRTQQGMRQTRNGTKVPVLQSTAIYFRDGQGFGLAVVSTWNTTDDFYPRHELHFRRRPRPH